MREEGHHYVHTVPELPWKRETSDDPLPADVPPSPDVRDEVDRPCCCVCGRPLKRGTAWTCFPCRKEHDLSESLTDWPEWARYLKASEERRRRHLKHKPLDNNDPDA